LLARAVWQVLRLRVLHEAARRFAQDDSFVGGPLAESISYAMLCCSHRFSCILKADVRPEGRAYAMAAWGRDDSPKQRQEKIFRRPARHGSLPTAGQVLRMHVDGRLTAPPLEVELVTNSVCSILLQGSGMQPKASGNPLDTFSLGKRFGSRTTRTARPARICEWTHRQLYPVSATQVLSGFQGAAAGS